MYQIFSEGKNVAISNLYSFKTVTSGWCYKLFSSNFIDKLLKIIHKFANDNLLQRHYADNKAVVIWLRDVALKTPAKWKEIEIRVKRNT